MACQFYNNNGCSCAGCVHLAKSTNLKLSKSALIATIPDRFFINHDKICLCIAQKFPINIPYGTILKVQVDDKLMPVITPKGNYVYADSIKSRKLYPMIIATDSKVFMLLDMRKLDCTQFEFPSIHESMIPIFTNKEKTPNEEA